MTNSASNLPVKFRQWLAASLAIAAVVGFVAAFAYEIWQVWNTPTGTPVPANKNLEYLATGLAGLVGGIVAVGFGQKPPSTTASNASRAVMGLSKIVTPSAPNVTVLAVLYVVAYFAVGIAAIITWVARSSQLTPMISSFAVSFIGLALAIVSAFFTP
jgi:hypothetical protein